MLAEPSRREPSQAKTTADRTEGDQIRGMGGGEVMAAGLYMMPRPAPAHQVNGGCGRVEFFKINIVL